MFKNRKRTNTILIIGLIITIIGAFIYEINENIIDISNYPADILPLYDDAKVLRFEDRKAAYELELGSRDDLDELFEYYYELLDEDNDYEIYDYNMYDDEGYIYGYYEGDIQVKVSIEDISKKREEYDTITELKIDKTNLKTYEEEKNKNLSKDDEVQAAEEAEVEAVEQEEYLYESEERADYSGVTIKVAHVFESGDYYNNMQQAIEELEEKYSGITLEVETISSIDYLNYLETAMLSGNYPDVFYFNVSKDWMEDFTENEFLLDLTPYYNNNRALKRKLPEEMLEETKYNDKIYGYPFGKSYFYLYYNQKLFEEYGLNPPKSYEDLLYVCESFKNSGITPIALSGQGGWLLMFQYGALALNTAGAEALEEAMKGERSFTEKPFVTAAEQLQELAYSGFFSEDAIAYDYMEAQEQFTSGEASMYYMADWSAYLLEENHVINVMLWPIENNKYADDRFGGSNEIFSVCSYTEYPDIAEDIAAYLAESLSETMAVPAFTNVLEEKDNQFAEASEGGENHVLWFSSYLSSQDLTKFYDYCLQLFSLEISASDFCELVDDLT